MSSIDIQGRIVQPERSFLETETFGGRSDLGKGFDGTNALPAFPGKSGNVGTLTPSVFSPGMAVGPAVTLKGAGQRIW
jgi:hypothetical protein